MTDDLTREATRLRDRLARIQAQRVRVPEQRRPSEQEGE